MNKNIHDGPNAETNGLRNELFELSQCPHIPSLTQRMVFLDIDTFSVQVKKFSVNDQRQRWQNPPQEES